MKPTISDPQYELYQGDAREVLPTLPEHSVDAIMTSPPYWGLRSYKADSLVWDDPGNCQHEWGSELIKANAHKAGETNPGMERYTKDNNAWSDKQGSFCLKCNAWRGQLGSEPDPDLFIKHLCDIFDLTKRVLKKTGSLWVNLDDSMSGGHRITNKGDSLANTERDLTVDYAPSRDTDIPAKSLCAIPERFVLEMLRRGWIYRQCIIWQKPSTMPESVKDRMTRDFEYLYHFTQQQKYFFERQFEPYQEASIARLTRAHKNYDPGYPNSSPQTLMNGEILTREQAETKGSLGRNKRSVWSINPEPQKAVKKGAVAHYAAFPTALCTIPILATVPEQICSKCGMPRVKVYKESNPSRTRTIGVGQDSLLGTQGRAGENEVKEVGLSDCGCGASFEPGTILDPFAGTGSVAVEARKLGRKAVLIEVSEQYGRIIRSRLGEIPLPLGG